LKYHKYTYWLAVPAVIPKQPVITTNATSISNDFLNIIYNHLVNMIASASGGNNIPIVFALVEDKTTNYTTTSTFTVTTLEEALSFLDSTSSIDSKVTIILLDQGKEQMLGWTSRNILTLMSSYHSTSPNISILALRNTVFR
jgi:hypothetical protein